MEKHEIVAALDKIALELWVFVGENGTPQEVKEVLRKLDELGSKIQSDLEAEDEYKAKELGLTPEQISKSE